jgi:hypothetical protein
MALNEQELRALTYMVSGQDPFAGCTASGDFGKRMQTLAALRRSGMIDHSNQPTALGRKLVTGDTVDDELANG